MWINHHLHHHEVEHGGKPYRYGSGWIVWDIPEEDIKIIEELMNE